MNTLLILQQTNKNQQAILGTSWYCLSNSVTVCEGALPLFQENTAPIITCELSVSAGAERQLGLVI